MNYEENRLNTFGDWPTTAQIEPIRVAKAGFYYTGRGVEVQCFSCGGKISEWNYGDQAMARHRSLDPRCPFLVDPSRSGNVALVLGQQGEASVDSGTNGRTPVIESPLGHSNVNVLDLENRPTLNSDDEIYRNDALRLLSYINWPVRFISRESLASAGFYHAGGGRVRCAWCGGELCGGWRLGDQPLDEHRRHFPHCEYVRRPPATPPPATAPPPDPHSQPATPPVGSPRIEEQAPQTEAVEHNWRVLESMPWRGLGVVGSGTEGAKHPGRSSQASRLASFSTWPSGLRQTPELLAEAGFFYTGSDDQVMCFYCGGGLGKWEPGDAPWSEHARWFPECGFVQLVKGREFIQRCQRGPTTNQINPSSNGNIPRRTNNRVQFPVTEEQVESEMENPVTLAALGTGLGVARVRTAIRKRLKNTGCGFTDPEALIDAALNEQLNEQSWSASTDPVLARDILSETLRTLRTAAADTWQRQNVRTPPAAPPAPPRPARSAVPAPDRAPAPAPAPSAVPAPAEKALSLEEENRQLKEARLCKVCMDCEVGAVFLPCGHLVSCAACGASLPACPLCRCTVQALVRAYLA